MFDLGMELASIRGKIFPKHKKSARTDLNCIIYKELGFNNETEFKLAEEKRDRRVAKDWKDLEKAAMIKDLFENGYRIEEIRIKVFPQMRWVRRGVTDQIILSVLGCGNWGDYESARRRVYAKNRGKLLSEAGWLKAKKKALERDGFKCAVTKSEKNLEVHHIDGNFLNNELNNLLTLCKDVHIAVTNGASGMTEDEITHWENYKPKYASFIRKRIRYLKEYAQHLCKMGYTNARVERQPAKGGYYWFAVHEPTDLHKEPGTGPLDKGGRYNEDPFHELILKLEKKNE